MKKVIMVFKSHLDMGYTDLAENVLRNYCTGMLEDMLETCEGTAGLPQGQRYVWTMPAWLLHHILASPETSTRNRDRLERCIWNRQVVWLQTPFTIHTEFSSLEEILRGFRFSDELAEQYRYHPQAAKMTDVPGHTTYLASILHKRGVSFMHMGCNPCCMPPDVPRLFWWQGPDGGRVLTMYSKGQYGSAARPPKDWPYPVWLALMQTNDNAGTLNREEVQKLLAEAQREMPGTEVVIGTLDDFYQALSECDLSGLPVVQKDLADTWIHGVGSYPLEVGQLRTARQVLGEAEKLAALCHAHGLLSREETDRGAREAQEAYTQGLLFDEHTWGMAGLTSLGRRRRYNKEDFARDALADETLLARRSWEEQRNRARAAGRHAHALWSLTSQNFAGAVLKNEDELMVFNGMGWARSGTADLTGLDTWLDGFSLADAETGKRVALVREDGGARALVPNVPAMGWKRLVRVKAGQTADANAAHREGAVLENKRFRIQVDPAQGGIVSLLDKTHHHEFVPKGQPLGRYCYDVYGDKSERRYLRKYVYRFIAWVIDDLARINMPEQEDLTFSPSNFAVSAACGDCVQTLRWHADIADSSVREYGNARRVAFGLTLWEDRDVIDLTVSLQGKQETAFPEGGSLSLPFALENCRVEVNKLGHVIDPKQDVETDANHVLYCCENWVALTGKDAGMMIVPLDTPLFGIGTKGIYEFESQRELVSPHLWFNLFNTQWGTNFPQWIGGDLCFRFCLIPLTGRETMAQKQRMALNAATPLLAAAAGAQGGPRAQLDAAPLLHCDTMRVLSMRPEAGKKSVLVRLQDIGGEEGAAVLRFSGMVGSVAKLQPGPHGQEVPVPVCGAEIVLKTKPFELHCLRLGLQC